MRYHGDGGPIEAQRTPKTDALANHAMDSHTSGSCAPSSPSAPPPAATGDRAAEKAAALAVVASLRALADAEEKRIEEEYT